MRIGLLLVVVIGHLSYSACHPPIVINDGVSHDPRTLSQHQLDQARALYQHIEAIGKTNPDVPSVLATAQPILKCLLPGVSWPAQVTCVRGFGRLTDFAPTSVLKQLMRNGMLLVLGQMLEEALSGKPDTDALIIRDTIISFISRGRFYISEGTLSNFLDPLNQVFFDASPEMTGTYLIPILDALSWSFDGAVGIIESQISEKLLILLSRLTYEKHDMVQFLCLETLNRLLALPDLRYMSILIRRDNLLKHLATFLSSTHSEPVILMTFECLLKIFSQLDHFYVDLVKANILRFALSYAMFRAESISAVAKQVLHLAAPMFDCTEEELNAYIRAGKFLELRTRQKHSQIRSF